MGFIEKKILWVCPENKGGIRFYSDAFNKYFKDNASTGFTWLEPVFDLRELVKRVQEERPEIIHFQHEFGIWGSKNPPFYFFPRTVATMRGIHPKAKLVATAHTVLGQSSRYSEQKPFKVLKQILNLTLLPTMKKLWMEKTWGPLDGVIVHSKTQVQTIQKSQCPRGEEIPHYVPSGKASLPNQNKNKKLAVFGYFSPEKGQDIAVRALKKLPQDYSLTLAGGVRREVDRPYYNQVLKLIREYNLSHRVILTGYLDASDINALYAQADVILTPFRSTYGSGSIVQAISHRAAIIASNLPLNQEINERAGIPVLELFESENPENLASKIVEVMESPDKISQLKKGADFYAEKYSMKKTAAHHLDFYHSILA